MATLIKGRRVIENRPSPKEKVLRLEPTADPASVPLEGVSRIEAGDAVVIRTGWHKLAEDPATYDRYLAAEPGIYVREAKYLADHRPVLIASDTFGLEVLGRTDLGPDAFPVHQWLLVREGVRIGEGVISDSLSDNGVYEFVYAYSPQYALGATAGNTPPVGLARGS